MSDADTEINTPDRAPLLAEIEASLAYLGVHAGYQSDPDARSINEAHRMLRLVADLLVAQDRRLFEANDAHEVATSECVRLRAQVAELQERVDDVERANVMAFKVLTHRDLQISDLKSVATRYRDQDAANACSLWIEAARNGRTPIECIHLIAEALGLRRAGS